MKVSVDLTQKDGQFLGALRIQRIVEELLSSGFEPRMHFAVAAPNGDTMTGRVDRAAEQPDLLKSIITHVDCPSGWFRNPIHVLFFDHRGHARHVTP